MGPDLRRGDRWRERGKREALVRGGLSATYDRVVDELQHGGSVDADAGELAGLIGPGAGRRPAAVAVRGRRAGGDAAGGDADGTGRGCKEFGRREIDAGGAVVDHHAVGDEVFVKADVVRRDIAEEH